MAVAQLGVILRINNQLVPDYAMPTYSAGVQHPRAGAVDQTGRPVGARGWASIALSWDEISMQGLQWWESRIGDSFNSAPVTQLLLPDQRSTQRIEGYLYHSKFLRGTLWRPELDEAGTWTIYSRRGSPLGEMYFDGRVVIRITELNRGAV